MALPVEAHDDPIWTLGDRIWKARKDAGLEQADLAEAVGVSRAQISKWERDQSEPRVSELQRVAAACRVPFRWLSSSAYNPDMEVLHGEPGEQMELSFLAQPPLAVVG
jgi:transcriptional regulator with XRE-family HTH domain